VITLIVGFGLTMSLPAQTAPRAEWDYQNHPADFNDDGDVDFNDVNHFVNCLTGPDIPNVDPACDDSDMDRDTDVDAKDFGFVQRCCCPQNQRPATNCIGSNVAPEVDAFTVNHSTMLADGTTEYGVSVYVKDANGRDDIQLVQFIFNREENNPHRARGHYVWARTEQQILDLDGEWQTLSSPGTGYWGFRSDGWGNEYITPTYAGTADLEEYGFRAYFNFKVNPPWADTGPQLDNFAGVSVSDQVESSGWKDSRDYFDTPVTFEVTGSPLSLPYFDGLTVQFDQELPDGRRQFTATLSASDDDGVSDIEDMRILLDADLTETTNNRGYLVWAPTEADITAIGGNWDTNPATGGGYYGFNNDAFGHTYIEPVSASTSTNGHQRTVNWTFNVTQAWQDEGPARGNYVGMFAGDGSGDTGWRDSRFYFVDAVIFDLGILSQPMLMADPSGLALGIQRLNDNVDWALDVRDNLIEARDLLVDGGLPVFESEWWDEASQKHWGQIYPEIFHHTYIVPKDAAAYAQSVAALYAVTGDPAHLDLVRETLLHYTTYDFFAIHPDVGLNFSIWTTQLMTAYDFVYDQLSANERVVINDFFDRARVAIKDNDDWWLAEGLGGPYNNHYTFHKMYIGTYGLFYGIPAKVDWAITSPMGMQELIENGTYDDGLWLENSLNYQFAAVNQMAWFAMHLKNSGYPFDLWNHQFAGGHSLEQLFIAPIDTLYPDKTLPMVGDCYGYRGMLHYNGWYLNAYDAYEDSRIAWLMHDNELRIPKRLFIEKTPQNPVTPSQVTQSWPEHGYVALRSEEGTDYWNGNDFSAFLPFGKHGIHGHNDRFSFTAFARGHHIAADAEGIAGVDHAFSSNIQGELNRTIACHNAVMVNWQNQNYPPTNLELVELISDGDVRQATVADRTGILYPGVRQMRTLAVTPDYLVDIFQVASDSNQKYQYMFHGFDDTGYFQTTGLTDTTGPQSLPWTWLREWKEKTVGHSDWNVSAQQGGLTTRLTMAGQPVAEPGTLLTLCKFPKNDAFEEPATPMLIATRDQVASTTFIAVLQAETGAIPAVTISSQELPGPVLEVTVTSGGTPQTFTVEKLQ
jgi:hypothetical protein